MCDRGVVIVVPIVVVTGVVVIVVGSSRREGTVIEGGKGRKSEVEVEGRGEKGR